MACAGLKTCEEGVPRYLLKRNATKRTLDLALDMLEYIKTIRWRGRPIELKIGIHRGKVIAGVLGYLKP